MNKKQFYIDLYKKYHEDPKKYPGISISDDIKFIEKLIPKYDAKSLLDFGCGKGYQYTIRKIHITNFFNIMPTLYDPGVEKYSKLPDGKFDGVISTDVLEHVPEEAIDEVLGEIYSKANKFVFISVSDIPAYAILPNGENAHITQKPYDWWIEKLKPFSEIPTQFVIRGNDRFIIDIISGNITSKVVF